MHSYSAILPSLPSDFFLRSAVYIARLCVPSGQSFAKPFQGVNLLLKYSNMLGIIPPKGIGRKPWHMQELIVLPGKGPQDILH